MGKIPDLETLKSRGVEHDAKKFLHRDACKMAGQLAPLRNVWSATVDDYLYLDCNFLAAKLSLEDLKARGKPNI